MQFLTAFLPQALFISMQIDEERLKELKDILEKDYKKTLSKEELFLMANNLLNYFDLLAKLYYRHLKNCNEKK
jgi:hypothetical protein